MKEAQRSVTLRFDNPPPRRPKVIPVVGLTVAIFIAAHFGATLYVETLWFDSLGYRSVFVRMMQWKVLLWIGFALATFTVVKGAFWLLGKGIGDEPAGVGRGGRMSPAKLARVVGWIVALALGLASGSAMAGDWTRYLMFWHQPATTAGVDPIFGRPIGFYLFTVPLLVEWSNWLWTVTLAIFTAAVVTVMLTSLGNGASSVGRFRALSLAFAAFLAATAWRVYLGRFTLLFEDHTVFSGITYTDAHVRLTGRMVLVVCLGLAALLGLANAVLRGRVTVLVLAGLMVGLTWFAADVVVPAYVTTFDVKPNELVRETPYIAHNIAATRAAFKLADIEEKSFDVDFSPQAFDLKAGAATLDNIQLWDWRALQATLRQVQEIRTYYDFPDVDVDRYRIGGQTRQMMLATRELSVAKLPESSRNWINERLVYTHGYGVTMNSVNQFTPEGQPRLVLANMPVESTVPDIAVTRPEIYFGELTDTDVYVKTKQPEFNFPQGETNNYTSYEGTGGIVVGAGLRRLCLAWVMGDLAKLPFSDDILADSRVLMRRNILDRVRRLTPYLSFDEDPYIVVGADGRLSWIVDGFTTSEFYPYSRHLPVAGVSRPVNYIRNSVKIVIDAYDGTLRYFITEPADPIVQAYRNIFPALFKDLSEMPADLRAHLRYPERMMSVQGAMHSLYHMDDPRVFYNREDLWSVATELRVGETGKAEATPIDPHYVLMQLPGEARAEFISILPFTPARRNNLIAWMAGRSDNAEYGKTILYRFPKSRLVDGPQQIESRIDQNAQLSGQLTLWNQQGSSVLRGQMLVIPLGKTLLYAEPIYLQASKSPMPELRLVVLASQDRMGYGTSFEEALRSFTAALGIAPPESAGSPTAPPGAPASAGPRRDEVIRQAVADFDAYKKLTAEGKFVEAAQKLEAVGRALNELQRTGQ